LSGDPDVPEDDSIQDVEFVSVSELSSRDLRSEYIERAVEDFQDGTTYPLSAVQDMR
jgi:hypothetical protein